MTEGSRFLLYVLLGLVGLSVLLLLLSLGPLGSPNPADRETCDYCDASL